MLLWKRPRIGFFADDSGAVTVDWVVLTAAVALLSIPLLSAVRDAVQAGATEIAADVEANVER